MATPDDHEPSFPDAVYQKVKDWVAKQEAFEKEKKAPAPLTDVQRMFLDGFRARSPLPDIGQVDYVSLLCRYRQAHPTGKDIAFTEGNRDIRNAEGNSKPHWTSTVELSEALTHEPAIHSFPAAGYGFDTTGCCPAFAKKKDAKQYAAKYAIDWLIQQSLMPSNLRDVTFLKQVPSARALHDLQGQPEKRPSEGTNGVLSPPPKRQTQGTNGAVDVDDNSLSATQRVHDLCQSMGLKPPRYELTLADPRVNYVFDGYPDFGDDADSFPEDLGRITGVAGRDNAKQEIAEKVLPCLRDMHQNRAAEFQLISESTGS